MIIIYTMDRAEKLANCYEKRRNWTVQRTAVKVSTARRVVGSLIISRGVYARAFKNGRLQFVIEHEWFDRESVTL